MNMSYLSDYFVSEKEDICLESHSTNSGSFLECSDGYTSSLDSASDDASDAEAEEDKSAIFHFYKTLSLQLLKTFSVEYMDVFFAVGRLMSSYKRVTNGILPTQIDYTKKSNCLAYLYRYAACHTALVFDAMSKIFDSSSPDVLSTLSKKTLNVIFLGGGPGNDFVGFLTALCDHHHCVFDLDVTIVDKMSGWEDVFNETVESLRRGSGGKAGSVFEEVNIMTTFILADLTDSEEWNEIMQAKLENADIVFFVKVLSHVPDGDKLQVLQNVVTSMKVESLLVYIDSPYPQGVFASMSGYLRTVYQSAKTKYLFKQKDSAFGYGNNDFCTATVKAFARRRSF